MGYIGRLQKKGHMDSVKFIIGLFVLYSSFRYFSFYFFFIQTRKYKTNSDNYILSFWSLHFNCSLLFQINLNVKIKFFRYPIRIRFLKLRIATKYHGFATVHINISCSFIFLHQLVEE